MYPIPVKQLSHFLTLLFLIICLNSKAQTDIQQDRCVDPILKQVDANLPGLMMFSRKDNGDKYVNMAALSDSTRMLTWFTCHGLAFDVVKLHDDVYNRIKSGSLDPFNYYKDYFFDLLSDIRTAAALFRQKGRATLNDTGNIYHRIYTYPPVQQARSTLQKEVAMEKLINDLCLQLSLFDSRSPQQLVPSDSFQFRLQLAGRMIRNRDTTTYYNTNPLSSVSRIVIYKQTQDKMFVYDGQGQLADSVPLKADKYASLLKEKEDVFLLYRGWLELQSQQAIAGKEEVARLLNREYTMPYKPVSWEQHKRQLQQTLLEVQEQVDAVASKVMGLIVPPQEETAQLLAAVYRDKPAEISYTPGLGFAYSIIYTRGHKRYELTDHRGNVMTVVSDRKNGVDENSDGLVEYYNADVVSAVDYSPFGSQMPGRTYSVEDKYRYGFNGKENDNEVKGDGNLQDYGMRIYDSRIGRFLSVDPLTKQYPELTPYQFASNRPIDGIDLDGLEYSPASKEDARDATAVRSYPIHPGLLREDVAGAPQREREKLFNQAIERARTMAANIGPTPQFGSLYESQQHDLFRQRMNLNAGYNPDGSKPALMQLAENKTWNKFANNLALPILEAAATEGLARLPFTNRVATSEINAVLHSTTREGAAESILRGIDPYFFSKESRFGRGFYTSTDVSTNIAELEYRGFSRVNTINYGLNASEGKFLNATSPILNIGVKEHPKILEGFAKAHGYDGIIYNSVRQQGGTNIVLFKNFDLLKNGKIVH